MDSLTALFDQLALLPIWVWAVALAAVVGGIVFYFRDKKKRLREYEASE